MVQLPVSLTAQSDEITLSLCHFLQDLEAFMQSSGDAGVVLVTFGSMVTNLAPDRANVIASALGRLPQKVRDSTHSLPVTVSSHHLTTFVM